MLTIYRTIYFFPSGTLKERQKRHFNKTQKNFFTDFQRFFGIFLCWSLLFGNNLVTGIWYAADEVPVC